MEMDRHSRTRLDRLRSSRGAIGNPSNSTNPSSSSDRYFIESLP